MWEIIWVDARRTEGDSIALQDVGDGRAMDPELLGELLRSSSSLICGDQQSDLVMIETMLGLLAALGPYWSGGEGQVE